MRWFNLFSRAEPDTHDYTKRYWGHDFCTMEIRHEGLELELSGWGNGIKKGDYLILPNKQKTTRYKVVQIRYCDNPDDMWFATCVFAPRS